MATFLMFGRYQAQALDRISAARTTKAVDLVKKYGGRMQSMYATLGENDLVLIATFPGTAEAMKASVALAKMTGIAFTTSPAVPVEEFDEIMSDI